MERLAFLDGLTTACVVPNRVYDEVVTVGVERGHTDARRIDKAVVGGLLDRRSVADETRFARLQENDRLSDADAAVLTIAVESNATAVMDEQYGRAVAAAEGFETKGTAYLVPRLLQQGRLTAAESRTTIDAMVDAGWYCAPNLYARLLQKIEEYE